jgi:serine protease Do
MTGYLRHSLITAVCTMTFLTSGICQQRVAKASAHVRAGREVVSRMPVDTLTQLSGSLQQLASEVSPAVVQIEVSGYGPADQGDRKDAAMIVRLHAIGSGMIVDPDGYIMTNAHVVAGAQRIRVVLSVASPTFDDVPGSGKVQVLDAKIVGMQKQADLALLKVEATNLPTLRFNLERSPQPGELVFAIGSPEGLQNSVTMGVISSVWRQPDPDNPMVYLQTDAPINPGNSGGPLVDVTGAVVGLNTFILSKGGGSEGLGFAIPARIADFIYHSLRKYGHVDHIEIGVVAQTITSAMAEGLRLAQNWGVVIADVIPSGPADAGGIRAGDIVLAVDGHLILGLPGFTASLYQHPTDQALKIDVLRGTQNLSLDIPAVLALDRIDRLAELADPMSSRIEPLGIFGLNFDEELRPALWNVRLGRGVIVVGQAPGFNSVDTRLQPGDLIHALNGTPIESVEQLKSVVAQLKPGHAAVLRIERQGQFQYVPFEME